MSLDTRTSAARVVIDHLAGEEAQALGHQYIGTEHLLLALLRDRRSGAANCLEYLDVDHTRMRDETLFICSEVQGQSSLGAGLTERAKRVISLARQEARRLKHSHLGTEHLLLALIREGEGIAASVLLTHDVTYDRVVAFLQSGTKDSSDYVRTTESALNPELEASIRTFFAHIELACIDKAIKGDLDYQGKWLTLSEDELKQYLYEELLDLLIYYAMGVRRFEWPI